MSTTTTGRSGRVHWLPDWGHAVQLTPVRIALIYAGFGLVALYISDVLFVEHLNDPLLSQAQAVKGFVEILVTAVLIFGLTRYSHGRLNDARERAATTRDELQLLHRVMRHNLRNDLNLIRGHADFIDTDGNPDAARHRQAIIEATENMMAYTEHARRIRKVTDATPQFCEIDLSGLLNRIVTFHPDLTDRVDVRTQIPDDVSVRANPMLEEALNEVIANAVTHCEDRAPRVDIELRSAEASMVSVCVADQGPGIPAAEKEAISGMQESAVRHSAGMGLWFVEWTVTHSGGDLSVQETDAGTTVCLHLPAASTD